MIDLNRRFRVALSRTKIPIRVFFEANKTHQFRVVDERSADPGVNDVTPVIVDCNHIEISKPPRADFRVTETIKLVNSAIAPKPDRPKPPSLLQQLISADEDNLPAIIRKVRRSAHTGHDDHDLDAALDFIDKLEMKRLRQASGSGHGPDPEIGDKQRRRATERQWHVIRSLTKVWTIPLWVFSLHELATTIGLLPHGQSIVNWALNLIAIR